MFPFQIDLTRLSYAGVLDALAPFIPGGIVALAWAGEHDAVWHYLKSDRVLAVALSVFVIYVVGFIILFLTQIELALVAYIALRNEQRPEPWKDLEWHKLASAFLGPGLSPPVDTSLPGPPSPDSPANAEELFKALSQTSAARAASLSAEFAWQRWYEILRAYFPPPTNPFVSAVFTVYMAIFHAMGWAGVVGASVCGRHVSWGIWLVCAVIIATCQVYALFNLKMSYNPDPFAYQLSAQLLRRVKDRGPEG